MANNWRMNPADMTVENTFDPRMSGDVGGPAGPYLGSKGANRQRAVQRTGAWNDRGMMTPGGGLAPGGAAAAGASPQAGGAAGAFGGGSSPQALAAVLRRMGGAGSGTSGQGGFSFGQQTDMNSLPGGPSAMGSQGPAATGGMRPAPWQGLNRQMYPPTAGGGASGFSGGGGQMWAGGSPTFDESAGGGFIGGGGLPGAAGGGMSPGAVPRTAGGMAFAPGMGAAGQQQADPWADFLAQYSQQ
jgi:hypothetical protein